MAMSLEVSRHRGDCIGIRKIEYQLILWRRLWDTRVVDTLHQLKMDGISGQPQNHAIVSGVTAEFGEDGEPSTSR
jgi:hypothetical protein